MAVVGMVQMAVHQVADMVAVRNGLMPASGAMDVALLMPETVFGEGRAAIRVLVGDFNDMLVHVAFMGMVEMAVVKIVDVIAVAYGRMAATGAVDVRMVLVFRIRAGHCFFP